MYLRNIMSSIFILLLIVTSCNQTPKQQTDIAVVNTTNTDTDIGISEEIISSTQTKYAPQIILKEGGYWKYKWQSADTTTAQGSSTTVDNKNGEFTLTLGTPTTINATEAFPLIIEGKSDKYIPRWSYLAIGEDGSLLGLENGTFKTIYSATESSWNGGGFFIKFTDSDAVKVTTSTYEGIYNTMDAVLVSFADASGGCEYLLGYTLCEENSASTSLKEYYKQGLGAIGYYSYSHNTYSGGNFYSSSTFESSIELVNSSFKAIDGTQLQQPSWEEEASLNYSVQNQSVAFLNEKLYIIGDNNSLIQVYNTLTKNFEDTIESPQSSTYNTLYELNGVLYLRNGVGIYSLVSPEEGSWTYKGDLPSSSVTTDTVWNYYSAEYNLTVDYMISMSPTNGLSEYFNITLFNPADTSISYYNDPKYNYSRWGWFEIIALNNVLYMIGGNYLSDSTWNTWSTHDSIAKFDLLNNEWLSSATAMQDSRESGFARVTLNDRIIIIGGEERSGKKLATVEEYNPSTNSWKYLEPLPEPLTNIQAAASSDKIYVITSNKILSYRASKE